MSKSRSSSEPPQAAPSLYETFGARLFGLNMAVNEDEEREARLPSPAFTHEWSMLENTVKRTVNCPCFQVVNPENLKSCKLCQGTLPVIK